MNAPLILLTAGGTGGHLFPAEALANALKAEGLRVALATDKRANAGGQGARAQGATAQGEAVQGESEGAAVATTETRSGFRPDGKPRNRAGQRRRRREREGQPSQDGARSHGQSFTGKPQRNGGTGDRDISSAGLMRGRRNDRRGQRQNAPAPR